MHQTASDIFVFRFVPKKLVFADEFLFVCSEDHLQDGCLVVGFKISF